MNIRMLLLMKTKNANWTFPIDRVRKAGEPVEILMAALFSQIKERVRCKRPSMKDILVE